MKKNFYIKSKVILIGFIAVFIIIVIFVYLKVFITIENPKHSIQNINNKIDEKIKNQEGNNKMEETELNIGVIINEIEYIVKLENNETVKSFVKLLPMEIDMSELNGNEKYCFFNQNLPINPSIPSQINNGDIMIYGNNCLVIFYESFKTSYSYTKIGKIENVSGLKSVLGKGNVTIKLKIIE